MRCTRSCWILVSLLVVALPALARDTSEVVVDTGKLVGVVDGDAVKFLGIPYAAPPVGALRWRAPQPPAKWSRARLADRYAPACLQPRTAAESRVRGDPGVSEDCLYLNIWTTKGKASKRPVLVWLHGGSFVFGSGAGALYDRSDWPQRGVVLVTLNYRLGRLGFFAHPALTAENPPAPLGNYALLDVIAALCWVQRNIQVFGGDPDNVTVGGVSAGGTLTYQLASTPLAPAGLFQRAITESAIALAHWPNLAEAEAAGARALSLAGLTARTAEELRALPAERVVGDFAMLDEVALRPTPIIDGKILPSHEAPSFARGEAKVPLLVGANSWEGSVLQSLDVSLESLAGSLGPARESALASYSQAAASLPAGTQRDRRMAMLLYGDQVFVAPARHMARQASRRASTFLYHFSYVTPGQRANLPGTAHGGELGYVFNSLATIPNQVPSASDRALAETVSAYWINFVKTGNPNGPGLPAWPAYTREGDELLELGNEGPKLRQRFLAERLDQAVLGTGDGGARAPCVVSGECAP